MNDQYISYEDYQRACELNDFDRNCTCGNNSTREEMLSTLKSLKLVIRNYSLLPILLRREIIFNET